MFIRTKKIKGKDYAYLVQTKWDKEKKKVVHQSLRYLGRVHNLENKEKEFFEFYNIKHIDGYAEKSFIEIVKDLVNFELKANNIDANFDFENLTINLNCKNTVFKSGEGFLCTYTLKNLLSFHKNQDEDEKKEGMRLIKLFVDAGLIIPTELFVKVFDKF